MVAEDKEEEERMVVEVNLVHLPSLHLSLQLVQSLAPSEVS
jgi:hypothetical protein